jgi:DNA-binding IclR family transcriptional regulator
MLGADMAVDRPRGSRKIRSVERALDVLECLASHPKGVSEIARQTGSSKATVHHILATLEERRIVARDPDSFRYRLSWQLYELGSTVVRNANFDEVVPRALLELARGLGETAVFAVRHDVSALILHRMRGANTGLPAKNAPGQRLPMHATASGKALLAHSPQYLQRLPFPMPKFTPRSVVDPTVLAQQLHMVRVRGFATSWQEHEAALSSISVPVWDHSDRVVAALTVTAPTQRLNQRSYRRYVGPLLERAREISVELGGPGVQRVLGE